MWFRKRKTNPPDSAGSASAESVATPTSADSGAASLTPVSDDLSGQGFLDRWSRRKQAVLRGQPVAEPAPAAPAVPPSAAPAPDLPDPQTLSADADFTPYLAREVAPALKRAAMRKLFSDPAFNQMDGLDVYIDDFNLIEDLPLARAQALAHVQEVMNPSAMQPLEVLLAERDGVPVARVLADAEAASGTPVIHSTGEQAQGLGEHPAPAPDAGVSGSEPLTTPATDADRVPVQPVASAPTHAPADAASVPPADAGAGSDGSTHPA